MSYSLGKKRRHLTTLINGELSVMRYLTHQYTFDQLFFTVTIGQTLETLAWFTHCIRNACCMLPKVTNRIWPVAYFFGPHLFIAGCFEAFFVFIVKVGIAVTVLDVFISFHSLQLWLTSSTLLTNNSYSFENIFLIIDSTNLTVLQTLMS